MDILCCSPERANLSAHFIAQGLLICQPRSVNCFQAGEIFGGSKSYEFVGSIDSTEMIVVGLDSGHISGGVDQPRTDCPLSFPQPLQGVEQIRVFYNLCFFANAVT